MEAELLAGSNGDHVIDPYLVLDSSVAVVIDEQEEIVLRTWKGAKERMSRTS